ncbi:hypothetical protein GQR58_028463 [Nymphon striatum]|nr:hypothetical protein GQR58_028463 [Nymphon striatum]
MINNDRFGGDRFKRESQTAQTEYRTTETRQGESRAQEFKETNASFDKVSKQREYHYDATSIASEGSRGREGRRRYSTYDTVTQQREEPRRRSYDERMPTEEQFEGGNRGESSMEQQFRSNQTEEHVSDRDNEGDHSMVRKNITGKNSEAADIGEENYGETSTQRIPVKEQWDGQMDGKRTTASTNRSKPMSKTSQKDNNLNNQGFYLTHLNMTSADVRRRLKEKEFFEEAIVGIKQKKEEQKVQKVLEKKENMEMLKAYNPWGRPGGGAPRGSDSNNKEKFINNLMTYEQDEELDNKKNLLSFGKPGNGAPNRTQSGRRVTQVQCDPNLRFQNNKDVRKSIENKIRYNTDQQAKKVYREDLDRMVEYKKAVAKEKQNFEQESKVINDPEGFDYNPWGQGYGKAEKDERGNIRRHKHAVSRDHGIREFSAKAPPENIPVIVNESSRGGAGAPIRGENGAVKTQLPVTLDGKTAIKDNIGQQRSRNGTSQSSAVEKEDSEVKYQPYARQKFIEKLGWSTSGQPHRRSQNAKKEYLDTLQRGMKEKENKAREEKDYANDGGVEFASLMRDTVVGKPKKDPYTGEILSHHKVRKDDPYSQGSNVNGDPKVARNMLHEDLTRQAVNKISNKDALKKEERRKSLEHIESWNGMWGKPGNGAPHNKQTHHLVAPVTEVPDSFAANYKQNILKSTHKHRYEVDSQKQVVGQVCV